MLTELAQLVERSTFNRVVVDSSPIFGDDIPLGLIIFLAFSTGHSGPHTRGEYRIVSTATQGILPKHFEDFHDCNPSDLPQYLRGWGRGGGSGW